MKKAGLKKSSGKSPVKKTNPIDSKQEVAENPDNHIDQDFPGYPHGNAKEELINPKTKEQKKTAGTVTGNSKG